MQQPPPYAQHCHVIGKATYQSLRAHTEGSLQIHGSLVSLRMDAMNGQMGGKTKPGAPPCASRDRLARRRLDRDRGQLLLLSHTTFTKARVFVKNLPGGSTDDSVRAIFEKFANVQGGSTLAYRSLEFCTLHVGGKTDVKTLLRTPNPMLAYCKGRGISPQMKGSIKKFGPLTVSPF